MTRRTLLALTALLVVARGGVVVAAANANEDACAVIGGKKWVHPKQARDCLNTFPVDPFVKANTIEVLNKTLAFHTSVNYQIQAPPPFQNDVKEDLVADLARIASKDDYGSEFELHLDLFRTFKRVNDGHCAVINYCYDSLYISYLPTPLVLLTQPDGEQNVFIAPEAFDVASAEFGEEIEFWQNALPGELKGQLQSLSGARVLLIDGQDPFIAVNKNALITGSYQSFGTRQNSFFASYYRGDKGWLYSMGNFAQQTHPLTDSVELTIMRNNSSGIDVITLPYRSRFGSQSKNFTDSASYRANNCVATNTTNGYDLYDYFSSASEEATATPTPNSLTYAQQQPLLNPSDVRRHPLNVLLDASPLTDIDLPEEMQPSNLTEALNSSYSVAQFYLMEDNKTGVLALGSFSAPNFTMFQNSLLDGLVELREKGARRLIVDVTNNGGGYICIAHWLHRIIIGPKKSTEPQAGLDTSLRASPLAQLIVSKIIDIEEQDGADPKNLLLYNPTQWTNASHVPFGRGENWLKPLRELEVNGKKDVFSQRLGQECQPFDMNPPDEGLFEPENVVIMSNGRCASSCSLFSITMSKLEGVRTIVVGGKHGVTQQYCGTVGGQSTDFSTIDTEIKSVKLKNHTFAPPDLLGNIVQGITWRLGFGINDKEEPEEWQEHTADINYPLTVETVNQPVALWEAISRDVFQSSHRFVVQSS
ncbi:hypothetical protein K435DRAFT_920625 [Dendrothele bispora CBS 962.96]|uniref:Tail specific protease domain-containing protein n=1 Tax=Dendrothele bispora (strain CBS 962.96) TaxID=1314807 RepID=A0A4S8MJH6_DENBC|nr:hypothetical protein K435DRAFT_920625 [Dendrothele bispora CBS 962.96]